MVLATPSKIGSSEVIKFSFLSDPQSIEVSGEGGRGKAFPTNNRADKIFVREKLNRYHEPQPAKADACGFVARAGL